MKEIVDIVAQALKHAQQEREKALNRLDNILARYRANKVHHTALDDLKIDHHGISARLKEHANVSVFNANTLIIKPWDKSKIEPIVKAIQASKDHDFSATNDGDVIRATQPALTNESRKKLVTQVRKDVEKSKVEIRNIRKQARNKIKKSKNEDEVKRAEKELQKSTDETIATMNQMLAEKEKSIMKV